MSYEMTGTVKVIQEEQTFSSGFVKREMVITVEDGKYPQDINLEFVQDNAHLPGTVEVGDTVTVGFDIRGREYNGRYFNNLNAWRLKKEAGSTSQPAPEPPQVPDDRVDDDDDVPF